MQCVDHSLQAVAAPSDWNAFLVNAFICHGCEKTFGGASQDLYFFPEEDALYHRHPDGIFYRAFKICANGDIEIGAFDSVEENVIQQFALLLDGKGGASAAGDTAALRASSRKFFDSMKRQRRIVRPAHFSLNFAG